MRVRFFCTAETCRLSPPCTTRSIHPARIRDECRTINLAGPCCESEARLGGGGDWSLSTPEQILPAGHGVHAGNAEESFPKSPVFFGKHGEHAEGRGFAPCSCRWAEKSCRNTQTRAPAQTPPRSLRRSYGDAKKPELLHAVMATGFGASSGRPPQWGTALAAPGD